MKRNQALYPDINFTHDPQERSADRASHKLYGVGGIPQQFISLSSIQRDRQFNVSSPYFLLVSSTPKCNETTTPRNRMR